MRKLNMFLVIGMLITFIAHAVMGSMRLLGGNADALKTVAWISVCFVAAHVVVTTILTIQTLRARKLSGAGYFKENKLFWARRISGFAILIPLVMHLTIFSASNEGAYRLRAFNTGRLISQLLLVITMAVHILSNMSPMLISLGIKGLKKYLVDVLLVLAAIFLVLGLAFLIYYLRWMRY